MDVKPDEVALLLGAVGGRGLYVVTSFEDEAQMERVLRAVEPYR